MGQNIFLKKKQLGFLKNNDLEYSDIKREVTNQIKKEFKPEFLNRIDEIIIFHKLTDIEIEEIFDVIFNKLQKRLKNKNIKVDISKEAKKFIVEKEKILEYGARPLKRAIQSNIEDLITDKILTGEIKEGMNIKLELKNEKLVVTV